MASTFPSAVLGGVDGIVTSFVIVVASDVGDLGTKTVAIVGFASLFADGTSMGISQYLAVSSERAQNLAARPLQSGATCFLAFVACGLVPLLTYLASASLVSCAAFSFTTLVLLGAARSWAEATPLLSPVLQTAALGSVAGGVAYAVGLLTHRVS
jgi:VIT1/CCC1 family predicted Fe2+/Mn2+ transporter